MCLDERLLIQCYCFVCPATFLILHCVPAMRDRKWHSFSLDNYCTRAHYPIKSIFGRRSMANVFCESE